MTETENVVEKRPKSKARAAGSTQKDSEILQKLADCKTFAEMRDFVKQLPPDVQKAYHREIAQKALGFVRRG